MRIPTAVTAPAGVSSWTVVSAGGTHTCGIANTGKLYCFGEFCYDSIGEWQPYTSLSMHAIILSASYLGGAVQGIFWAGG